MKKNLIAILSVICFCSAVYGQSTANYTFSTGTGESLVDMSSETIDLISNTGSRISNIRSSIITFPEGFRFWFMGIEYSQLSVNSNGIARFGGTQIETTTYNYGASGQALLCPLGRTTSGLAVGEGGKVHYKLIGTFPERKLVIEWKEVEINKNTAGATADCGNFQLILTEVENSVEFRYSDGIKVRSGGATTEYRVGISSSNTATTIHTVSNLNSGTLSSANSATIASNTAAANSIITNLQGGRYIRFKPTASVTPRTNISFSAVGTTSMTVHWSGTTDAKTAIYYSIDGVNWTRGNVTLLSSTTSSSITSLKCGTEYQWRVYSINAEGRFSDALEGVQATNICQPSSNGNWHTASIWPGSKVPDSYQNVTIPSPRNITISSYTEDALCNNLNLNSGATLTIASSKKLVVAEDFNIEGAVYVTSTQGCNEGGGTTCVKCSDCGTPNTNDNIPIYRGSLQKIRVQFLYLKAELTDLDEKVISGFSFDYGYMSAPPSSFDLTNLTIRVGHTSTGAFASSFITPSDFTTTYGPSTYSISNSSSAFSVSFTQGFIYDESKDNLLIEMTYETDGANLPYVNTIRYSGCGVIPANTVIITANNCAGSPQSITYNESCSGVFAQQGSARPGLLVNNCDSENWGEFKGDIDILGDWIVSATGEFNPGEGTVSFVGGSDQTITPNTSLNTPDYTINTFHNMVLNKSNASNTLTINTDNSNDSIVITNNLTLLKGVLTTASDNAVFIRNSNANSLTYNASKASTGWINGSLIRKIATNTGTYGFPLGTADDYRLAELINNNLGGVNYIDAKYITSPNISTGSDLDPLKAIDLGTPYISTINAAWQLNPNSQPTSGKYDVRLYIDGGTGANVFSLNDNQFGILKRPSSSTSYDDYEAVGNISDYDGEGRLLAHLYALRKNLESFSEHTVGIGHNPLPVTLTNFFTLCNNGKRFIHWQTQSEINNNKFIIEKSYDAKRWVKFEEINGSGNSNSPRHYSTIDNEIYNDIIYYRLLQEDYDGSINICSYTHSLCKEKQSDEYYVQTLSNNNSFFVSLLSGNKSSINAKVYDIFGKVIYDKMHIVEQGNSSFNVELTSNVSGAYILSLYNSASQITSFYKIVAQ